MICSSDSAMEWELKLYQKPGPRSFLLNLLFELWCHIQFCIQRQTTLLTNSLLPPDRSYSQLNLPWRWSQSGVSVFVLLLLSLTVQSTTWLPVGHLTSLFSCLYIWILKNILPVYTLPKQVFFSFSYFTCDKHIAICINLERRRILI